MDSILNSIKKLLGIDSEYTVFDTDIIIHINTAINTLSQLGVESAKNYSIIDEDNLWSDLVNDASLELIKTYIYLKVRMVFDPPTGSVSEAFKETITELEWRINNEAEIINA